MPLLDQQELMEAPPERRLIVPRGHRSWWGCDPGTQRVALACVHGSPEHVYMARTASFAPMRGGARLSALYADTRSFARRLLGDGWPAPGLVLCELPAGNPPNVELIYAAGVQQAAVFDAVVDVTGHRVTVETMPTARWKRLACGAGNIYKPDPRKGRKGPYGVLVWAARLGYAGQSMDEADAMGLAEAGRRTVALDER